MSFRIVIFLFLIFPIFSIAQNITIKKLNSVNSIAKEANAYINPQRNELYFMSTRGNIKSQGSGDIYKSLFRNNSWSKPIKLDDVNSNNGEDEPIISFDSIFIYESWKKGWIQNDGPYYKIIQKEGKTIKKGLHPAITRFFLQTGFRATDGACISIYGNIFMFASGKSLNDNMDIYYINITNPNSKVKPYHPVNTLKDERTPFLAADNQTLYFASNGYHKTIDLDILKTTWKHDTIFTLPIPMNTTKNDYNFSINANADWAYLIRDQDIYEIDMQEVPHLFKPIPIPFVKTKIKDCLTGRPLNTNIIIFDQNKIDYQTYGNELNLPITHNDQYILLQKENYEAVLIQKYNTPQSICLSKSLEQNIYFGFDSYYITKEQSKQIKQYYTTRNENSYIAIGMTDYKGNEKYNMALSKKRIASIKEKTPSSISLFEFPWGEKFANQKTQENEDRKVILKKVKIIR